MGAVKAAMLIGSGQNSIITTEAFAINGEFDMDALGGILNFNLPYIPLDQRRGITGGVDLNILQKFDTVKLYFTEADEDFTVTGNNESSLLAQGFVKVFDGFIDSIKLSKSKDNYNYALTALGTIGLADYRTLEYQKTQEGGVSSITREILRVSALSEFIEFESVLGDDTLPISIDGGKTAKDFFTQIREKYAVILHQGGDGILKLETSEFFAKEAASVVYEFDFREGNVYDLDYGQLENNYNTVVVFGFPPNVGVAVDAIAVENNDGKIAYLSFENRDLKSNEDCEKVAREKLLELERNFSISFRTAFNPFFRIGQCFTLKDYDKYTGNERFIIKKYVFTIDKTDVSCTVYGYTHSLTQLPEDIVLDNTGVADIDILGLRSKIDDAKDWGGDLRQ